MDLPCSCHDALEYHLQLTIVSMLVEIVFEGQVILRHAESNMVEPNVSAEQVGHMLALPESSLFEDRKFIL